jgi:type IV/VI secretion system ImpK/VasF family protein
MKSQNLNEYATSYFATLCTQLDVFESNKDNIDPSSTVLVLDIALREFQRSSLLLFGDADLVADACYLMSTVSDEFMYNTCGLAWTKHSMLVRHYGDAHGGERCWQKLDTLLSSAEIESSVSERQLLELYELALSFGWRGKLKMLPDGEERVHDLRLKLHYLLHAGESCAIQTRQLIQLSTNHLDRRTRKVAVILTLIVFTGIASAMISVQYNLNRQWENLTAQLHRVVSAVPLNPPER